MRWFDKLISHTALVKSKNEQLQKYSDHITYLRKLVIDLIDDAEIVEGIDYAEIAKRKAELCNEFFTELKEEQQKNKKLERQIEDLRRKSLINISDLLSDLNCKDIEINALKHMLDRYEDEHENER